NSRIDETRVVLVDGRATSGCADERCSSDRVLPQRPRGTCGRRAPCNLRTGEMRRRQVTTGGFSSKRLARVRELLERHVDSGFVPGVVAVLARHGEVQVEATGNLAFEGAGSRTPMAGNTICRMGSMTKPIVAACAMPSVEDGTLALDDPVGELRPGPATG